MSPLARIRAVVMGTSAGGVEALGVLLPALPRDLLTPVFVVIHQRRERPSLLASLFGPRCAVPVTEAEDKQPVAPGNVYFAPPDYHLLLDRADDGASGGTQLALSADAELHFSRPSIDVLFESAADIYGADLLGILLTGANADGAAGLLAIRKAGGLAVVQDPAEAQVPTMPAAAVRCGAASQVLGLQAIAAMLGTLPTRAAASPRAGLHTVS